MKSLFLFILLLTCSISIVFPQNNNTFNQEKIDVDAIFESLKKEILFGRKILHIPLELILKSGLIYARNIAIAKLNQKIAQSQYKGELAPFAPELTTSYSNEKNAPNIISQDSSSVDFSISNSASLTTTFSQKTPVGIRYGLSINATDTDTFNYNLQNNIISSKNNEKQNNIVSTSLNLNIPLAQGLGAINTISARRNFITTKEREKDILNEILIFFQNLIQIYWELKQVYAMYEVQNEKILLSEKLYQENKLRQNSGAGDTLQVVSSFNNYQNDKIVLNNILNAIIDTNEQIKDIFDLLELNFDLYPSDDFPLERFTEKAEVYLEKMIKTHPNFLGLEIAKNRNQTVLIEGKNESRPDIDLNLRYSQIGAGINRTQALDTVAISEIDAHKIELTWRLPFGNKSAKSKKNEALYQGLILDKQFLGIKSSAKLTIRKRLRDLETKRKEIAILEESFKVTEKNFRREQIKYDNGSSTSLILQEIQTELINSKFYLIKAQKDYAILHSQMLIDTSEIFNKYSIPTIPLENKK